MARQNTAMQKSTSAELAQISTEKLDQLDVKAREMKGLALNATDSPFTATLATATALQTIRELMNDKAIMDGIMSLQGTKIGFVTDRDNPKSGPKGYPMETVVDVTIEAATKGARMIGNEVNIISGACYLTKAYFQRKLDEELGQGKWRFNHEVPVIVRNSKGSQEGAKVTTTITWTDSAGAHSEEVTHAIKGNDYSTPDAYMGKADRKCGKWLLENITGERFNDGDADDIINVQAQSVDAEPMPSIDTTPATQEKLDWIRFLCKSPAIIEESETIEIVQAVDMGEITADEANKMHKRLVRLFRAKGLQPPTTADFEKSKGGNTATPEQPELLSDEKEEEQPQNKDRAFTMRRLHALGNELYPKDWDAKRKELVKQFNPEYESASDLNDSELKDAVLTLLSIKQGE